MGNVHIRLAQVKDAERTLEIQKAVLAEERFLPTTLEEFKQTVEGQQAWIQAKLEHDHETMLVAEVEGNVIGWLVFQSPTRM